ncbi:MAG: nitroreductase family protein [Bacillota bacterium]|nr:nitroreductase family protein [Bacillota bacterium]
MKAIEQRRSIRKFKSDEVESEIIKQLLEAAQLAPSGSNIQPWRFMAVTSEGMRAKLTECTLGMNFIAKAPLTMVCCTDLAASEAKGERVMELKNAGAFKDTPLENVDVSLYKEKSKLDDAANLAYLNLNTAIAIEQMILRGTDLGLGSCWVMMFSQRKVKQLLNLPENIHVVALVPFGYPDQDPKPRPRIPMEQIFLGEV